ncbi:MAG: MFS transporter, partial [Candidatus Bipolaricaulia bacterium]
VLAAGVAAATFVIGRFPSTDSDQDHSPPPSKTPSSLRSFLDLGSGRRSAWGAIATGGFIFFAGTNVQLVYGSWLERSYGLGAGELGTTALLVGLALLTGSVGASLLSDRLGKRRSVLLGLVAMIGANLLLPLFDVGRIPAILGTMLALAMLEFTIVSHIPMMTEQVPEQRGKVMSLAAATSMIGRTLGSLTGPWALASFGIGVVGPLAAVIAGGAVVTLTRFVRDAEVEAADVDGA